MFTNALLQLRKAVLQSECPLRTYGLSKECHVLRFVLSLSLLTLVLVLLSLFSNFFSTLTAPAAAAAASLALPTSVHDLSNKNKRPRNNDPPEKEEDRTAVGLAAAEQ